MIYDRESCIPRNHALMENPKYKNYPVYSYYSNNNNMTRRKKIIEDGAFTLDDCKQKYHWQHIVPTKRDDIPHTGYNKERNYIYYYLIECYRYKNHRKTIDMNTNKRTMDRLGKNL
jgi:hypothetical protein